MIKAVKVPVLILERQSRKLIFFGCSLLFGQDFPSFVFQALFCLLHVSALNFGSLHLRQVPIYLISFLLFPLSWFISVSFLKASHLRCSPMSSSWLLLKSVYLGENRAFSVQCCQQKASAWKCEFFLEAIQLEESTIKAFWLIWDFLRGLMWTSQRSSKKTQKPWSCWFFSAMEGLWLCRLPGAVGITLLSPSRELFIITCHCWTTARRQNSASSLHRDAFPNPSVLFPVTKRSVSSYSDIPFTAAQQQKKEDESYLTTQFPVFQLFLAASQKHHKISFL